MVGVITSPMGWMMQDSTKRNFNAEIQDLILRINEVLAPEHFADGHPEPVVFQRFRREVVDCPKRPMGCVQLDLSVRTMFGQDEHRCDVILTMDTNAHTTCEQGWMNFHAHVVNFEMRGRGKVHSPLTLRIADEDAEDGKRMADWLADLLSKLTG